MKKIIGFINIGAAALKVLCCALAIVLLLIPFTVYTEKTLYAAPPGEYVTEIDSEGDFDRKNFFEYIDYLDYKGGSPDAEIVFLVFLGVSLLLSLLMVALAFADLLGWKVVRSLPARLVALALAVFPLVSFVLAIVQLSNIDSWRIVDYEHVYLSGYAGWNIYYETAIEGNATLIPTIVLSLLAFLLHVGTGVLGLLSTLSDRKAAALAAAQEAPAATPAEAVAAAPAAPVAPVTPAPPATPVAPAVSAGAVADNLMKFKQLLDMGAITEEEYNAKKAELLHF